MVTDDFGGAAETLVARICSRAFLSDFVVRNPKFKFPGSSKELEAADVLVLFGTKIISIQVKARGLPRKPTETEKVYRQRLLKRIEEGVEQVRTTSRALKARALHEVTTERGLTVPVPAEALDSAHGIVILDLPAERDLGLEDRSLLYYGVSMSGEVPVHAFLSDDFDAMLTEIDTLPDFLKYLEFRETLFRDRKIFPYTHNLDLLAMYKIHFELQDANTLKKLGRIMVEEGYWEHYVSDYEKARRRRVVANRHSYMIDEAIDFLHRAFVEHQREYGEQWARMSYELANLTRMERRCVGARWHAVRQRATSQPDAFSVCMMEERPDEAVLVYAGPEEGRSEELQLLAAAVCVKLNLRRIRAFGMTPANTPETTMQMVVLEGMNLTAEDHERFMGIAEKRLGPLQFTQDFEFGSPETEQSPSGDCRKKKKASKMTKARKKAQRCARKANRG